MIIVQALACFIQISKWLLPETQIVLVLQECVKPNPERKGDAHQEYPELEGWPIPINPIDDACPQRNKVRPWHIYFLATRQRPDKEKPQCLQAIHRLTPKWLQGLEGILDESDDEDEAENINEVPFVGQLRVSSSANGDIE